MTFWGKIIEAIRHVKEFFDKTGVEVDFKVRYGHQTDIRDEDDSSSDLDG